MYATGRIRSIHLELTSKCNAACPMCARNIHGGIDNPLLPLTELTLDDMARILRAPWTGVLQTLDRIVFCGTYGDPIIARDLIPILHYLRGINPEMTFSINTNGSARTTDWWRQLGSLLRTPRNNVVFGIDGLADTNHIYRARTNFAKIMANARTFIDAGGIAHWTFLVFRHNEHQVEEARSLAMQMGFRSFGVRRTTRFGTSPSFRVKAVPPYDLYPASDGNAMSDRLAEITANYGSYDSYLDTVPITCQTSAEHSLYLSAEGFVFPCCWMGTLYNDFPWFDVPHIKQVIDENGGLDMLNAKHHTIETIVTGAFFTDVMRRWSADLAGGRMRVCANFCGKTNRLDSKNAGH